MKESQQSAGVLSPKHVQDCSSGITLLFLKWTFLIKQDEQTVKTLKPGNQEHKIEANWYYMSPALV